MERRQFQLGASWVKIGKERSAPFAVESFVVSSGPAAPKLLLIGEAPGEQEAVHGRPFIGRAGAVLDAMLHSIGVAREEIYITSAFKSRPYSVRDKRMPGGQIVAKRYNRTPTKREVRAHAELLDEELRALSPLLLVTLGNVALQRLLGSDAKVGALHGQLLLRPVLHISKADHPYEWTESRFLIVPTFHPASVFYNPSLREQMAEDWRVIGEILQRKANPPSAH